MLSRHFDPVMSLPLEVVGMIFEYLTMRERVLCLAVSKSWNILLESARSLWTTVYTTRECQPIPLKALKEYLRRSRFTVDSALIHRISFADIPNMEYLMDKCHGLRDLSIYGDGSFCQSLGTNLASAKGIQKLHLSQKTPVSVPTMIMALNACRNTIREAKLLCVTGNNGESISSWPEMNSLTRIHLDFCNNGYIKILGLIQVTPNICSAVINNCQSQDDSPLDLTLWPNLETLDLTETQLEYFPKLPLSLKHLVLDGSCDVYYTDKYGIDIYPLPLLETLSFQYCRIDGPSISTLTESCIRANNLKILLLGGVEGPYPLDHPFSDLFPASATVEELSMSAMDLLDEEVIEITKFYPSLKKVDLSYNDITAITINELVKIGVKFINIDECSNVNSDTVEMARAEGVYVSHEFIDDSPF
ncbi:hypothetical protein BGT96224_A20190 [Blumeria graminis f. sp. tritici 96224]|nr:hypothetical protein BGT96224_A20190 [Blumeria graminis f. sp. tritici 96224]